ncbi:MULTISPECIES: hypothetical protein [Streptomyces]|uniref:Uncharacterized protein n=1 Tax=Streptomyces lycii TaxID=2654337 RepID=A0ABQ7FJU4_9ACTN|nr:MULTISPECIES: hypothetical protein [Streptomyces]KAF4409110.1 hypothetical protein GCU69_10685 [Streptomyces lycii]PGH47615.1 hypothetical protein CRI70_27530 [Streptomyces sp. Ru87]
MQQRPEGAGPARGQHGEEDDGGPRTRPEATPQQDGADAPGDLPIGKADTPNVAGSDEQQPEIAEGPVPGVQPGEKTERGPWTPPVEEDPPPRGAAPASGDPEAVRRQKKEGGP